MKPDTTHLSRRAFLLHCVLWSGWASLGLALIHWLRVPAYAPSERHVELDTPESYALGVTSLPLYQAWLVRSSKGFFALRAVCTHLGCPPRWEPEPKQFVCPCHDSRFDSEGALRQGPALRALERYEIYTTPSGRLALNLDRTYRRENGGWRMPSAFVSWPV